jgi:muconolactone delta-isomerase
MKYLVVASGGPGFASPEEAVEVLQGVILPSFKELIELEKRKKIIAGGVPVGDRAFVFIAEAKSNDELDQMLRRLPMWGGLDWDVTALQTFSGRAKQERQAVRELRKTIKDK